MENLLKCFTPNNQGNLSCIHLPQFLEKMLYLWYFLSLGMSVQTILKNSQGKDLGLETNRYFSACMIKMSISCRFFKMHPAFMRRLISARSETVTREMVLQEHHFNWVSTLGANAAK